MKLYEEMILGATLSCFVAFVMFATDVVPVNPDSGISNMEYLVRAVIGWWER